jgi:hypothetical protein
VAVEKCCIRGGLDSMNGGRPDGGGASPLAAVRQEKEAK